MKHWWKWMFFWSTSQLEKTELHVESSHKSDVMQFLLINPPGKEFVLSLSLSLPVHHLACWSSALSFWITDLLQVLLGLQQKALGPQRVAEKSTWCQKGGSWDRRDTVMLLGGGKSQGRGRASWLGGEDDSHQISWEQPGSPEHHHSRHLAQQWGQNRAHQALWRTKSRLGKG